MHTTVCEVLFHVVGVAPALQRQVAIKVQFHLSFNIDSDVFQLTHDSLASIAETNERRIPFWRARDEWVSLLSFWIVLFACQFSPECRQTYSHHRNEEKQERHTRYRPCRRSSWSSSWKNYHNVYVAINSQHREGPRRGFWFGCPFCVRSRSKRGERELSSYQTDLFTTEERKIQWNTIKGE